MGSYRVLSETVLTFSPFLKVMFQTTGEGIEKKPAGITRGGQKRRLISDVVSSSSNNNNIHLQVQATFQKSSSR